MPLSDAKIRRLRWPAIAVAAFALVHYPAPVLTPLFMTAVLACIFNPPVAWLGPHRVPRVLAVAPAMLAGFLMLALRVALRKLRARYTGSNLYPGRT